MAAVIDHARHTPFSDPGRHAAGFAELPVDPEALSAVSRNVIVHYRASGEVLPAETRDDINARWLEAIVDLDQARHPRPLTEPRPVTERVQGCCRDHTLFCVGALRTHGVPARSRCRVRRLLRRWVAPRSRRRGSMARRTLAAIRLRAGRRPTGPADADGHRTLRRREHRFRHGCTGVGRLPARSARSRVVRCRSDGARPSWCPLRVRRGHLRGRPPIRRRAVAVGCVGPSSPRATSSSRSGTELDEVCRHLQIAESTWHRWIAQYGGMKANDAKRLKELEGENARLKRLLADAELDKDMLREIASGNF